jgi:hypothetical protein
VKVFDDVISILHRPLPRDVVLRWGNGGRKQYDEDEAADGQR